MKIQKRMLAYAIAALLSNNISAADNKCEGALGYIQDKTKTSVNLTERGRFKRFFCDQKFSSYKEVKDKGAEFDVFPDSFNGHQRDSEWSEYKRSVCENIESSSQLDQSLNQFVAKANEAVVKAWSDCVASLGVKFWAEVDEESPYIITLVTRYNGDTPPYEGTILEPLTISPSDDALHCVPPNLGRHDKINSSESRINCTRRIDGPIKITLHTVQGDKTVKVPELDNACNGIDEVVDALYSQIIPAAPYVPITSDQLRDTRQGWIDYLRATKSVEKLAKKMVEHDGLFKGWIVQTSLGANPKNLQNAYTWMINAIYYQFFRRNAQGALGEHGLPAEAEAFVARMPNQCDGKNLEDKCYQMLVAEAQKIIDTTEWKNLYKDNTVPLMDTNGHATRVAKYCKVVSECLANPKSCG